MPPTSTTSTWRPTRGTRTSPPTTAPGAGAGRGRRLRCPCAAVSRRPLRPKSPLRLGAGRDIAAPVALTGVSYVLPLRWTQPGPSQELVAYLLSLRPDVDEVLVVDGC